MPQSSMDEVALKVSRGIATERIMEGLFILIFTVCAMNNHNFCYFLLSDIRERVGHRVSRHTFEQKVSRKHFLSKQDIRNVKRSVLDRQIKRHENDAMSVAILVHELQNEPFNPILFYKPQGSESEKKLFSKKILSFLLYKQSFR